MRMPRRSRLVAIIVVAVVVAGVANGSGFFLRSGPADVQVISLNDLAARVQSGDITEIRVTDTGGRARTRAGELLSFSTGSASVLKVLADFGVPPDAVANVTYSV